MFIFYNNRRPTAPGFTSEGFTQQYTSCHLNSSSSPMLDTANQATEVDSATHDVNSFNAYPPKTNSYLHHTTAHKSVGTNAIECEKQLSLLLECHRRAKESDVIDCRKLTRELIQCTKSCMNQRPREPIRSF